MILNQHRSLEVKLSSTTDEKMIEENANGIVYGLSESTSHTAGIFDCKVYDNYPEENGKLIKTVTAKQQMKLHNQNFDPKLTRHALKRL